MLVKPEAVSSISTRKCMLSALFTFWIYFSKVTWKTTKKNPSWERKQVSALCIVMSCTSAHPNVFDLVAWRYITFCINKVNEIAVRFNDCRWVYDLCCSFVCSWANGKQGWYWLWAACGWLGIELTQKKNWTASVWAQEVLYFDRCYTTVFSHLYMTSEEAVERDWWWCDGC